MEREKVVVKRQDGSTFEAVISSLDQEMSCAVVRHAGKKLVIVEVDEDSATWREVPKHRRGDIVTLDKKEPARAKVIHVLEPDQENPLTYVYIREGHRFPDVATPHELIEDEAESEGRA